MQSYVLLGAEDEGLNLGIEAKKVLGGLLLLGLRNLRVHCCAEDTEANSAREMFLGRVGLFEHLVADIEGQNLENGRPFVYDEVPHPRVAGGGLRMVGVCVFVLMQSLVGRWMKRLDLFGEGMECKGAVRLA